MFVFYHCNLTLGSMILALSFHANPLECCTFLPTDDKLSHYDPLDLAHNHSHFELKWRKTARKVEEEEEKCFQVRRDGRSYYEEGVNIQTDKMVESYMYNRTTLTTSSAAVSRDSMEDTLNTATLVAMLLSGAVFIALVIALLIYRYYRRTSGAVWISKLAFIRGRYRTMRNEEQGTRDNFIMGFSNPITESSAESVDKADGQVTVLSYRPLPEDGQKDGIKDYSLLYNQMFPRERLVFGADLGTGWFGKVYEADAYRIKTGWRKTKVVVKELRKNSVSQTKEVFLKETDVLRRVEHKNVLRVLGQATEQEPFIVILEHSSVGDLKKFLLEQRCNKKREGVPLALRMSIDIASGLHCLHANYFYHSDLAARNCLVFPDLSVKIGDYGISRCVYKDDYYNRPNAPNTIPVRWLAPEGVVIQQDGSLVTKPASSHGNAWSFGVTLWEIAEGGKQPYEELSDEEVLQSVIQDQLYQLPEPHNKGNVLDLLYELMLQCWVDPERRPSVQKLESTLMSLMSGRSVPCLTTGANLKQVTEPVRHAQAADDTKNSAQPIAIVHPLQPDRDKPNSYESTAVPSDSQDQEQNSSDLEVTIISSESPPPVTYIGNPSEELGETSEVSADSSTNAVSLDSQPCGVVESDPGSDHEFVIVPGEVIRRRGSILKNPNAPSKPSKVVHFPINILALRTVHKYERMDSFEEGNNSVTDEEDGEDENVVSMWSRDYPLSSFECDEYRCKFPVEKDFESLDLNSPEENGTDLADEPPSSLIAEKKTRMAVRRKKLEDCGQEWVTAIDSTEHAPA